MEYPAWLTARREPGDREIGAAFFLMGALGLAGCVLGSLLLLLILGPFERPDPVPIDYVFRQRWTWINELAPLFIAPFPATCGGILLARAIAERRQLLPPFGNVDWSRVSAFGERLALPPVAGAVAGALLYAAVNPGAGLVGAGAFRAGNTQGGAIEGVGALILAGASVGWGIGLLLTGAAMRRRAGTGATQPARPAGADEWAAGTTCIRVALVGFLGAAAGALVAWWLWGLADRPLELVRDPGPARIENWDWLNEGRHVLVGASIGLFAGMIAGRLLATRTLRAAGYEGMPFGPLRPMRTWLVGLPIVSVAAALVVNEMQNPDRIFELTLPIVLSVLVGLTFALLLVGVRLRDSPSPMAHNVGPGSGRDSAERGRSYGAIERS